jgi:hypothetical protein
MKPGRCPAAGLCGAILTILWAVGPSPTRAQTTVGSADVPLPIQNAEGLRLLVATDQSADAAHVMTTWHADESPDDVAFFFVLNTNFNEHDLKCFLVLHVGDGHATGEVDAAVRRHAVNDGAA